MRENCLHGSEGGEAKAHPDPYHDDGKWFSLMDNVFAPATLELASAKVRANKGAAGVDGKSPIMRCGEIEQSI